MQLTEHLTLLMNINKHSILECVIKECNYIDKVDTICITSSYTDNVGELSLKSIEAVYNQILRTWV